jgi:hypothetical protein
MSRGMVETPCSRPRPNNGWGVAAAQRIRGAGAAAVVRAPDRAAACPPRRVPAARAVPGTGDGQHHQHEKQQQQQGQDGPTRRVRVRLARAADADHVADICAEAFGDGSLSEMLPGSPLAARLEARYADAIRREIAGKLREALATRDRVRARQDGEGGGGRRAARGGARRHACVRCDVDRPAVGPCGPATGWAPGHADPPGPAGLRRQAKLEARLAAQQRRAALLAAQIKALQGLPASFPTETPQAL